MRPLRPSSVLVVLALAALAQASCITPSIPIPPPSPEAMTFNLDPVGGTATFAYPANVNYGNAIVYVFNRTVGLGVITTAHADGSVSATPPFPAHLDDEVAVTFEADTQTASTCVVLKPNGPIPDCVF